MPEHSPREMGLWVTFFSPPLLLSVRMYFYGQHVLIFPLILKNVCLFYFCLCWSSLLHAGFLWLAASRACSWSRCASFSLLWLLLLQSTGFRRVDSVVMALEQRSPTFLASGTGFMEDNFSAMSGGGSYWGGNVRGEEWRGAAYLLLCGLVPSRL